MSNNMNKLHSEISLQEACDLIVSVGDKVTFLMQGHTGNGKSATLPVIGERLGIPPSRQYYFDCTTKQSGDVSVPKFTTLDGRETLSFIPNSELGFGHNDPVLVMVDELAKGDKGVIRSLCRFLHEGKIGEFSLPPGSRRFATTNLGSEGFGDSLQAYVRNRFCTLKIRKQTNTEWIENFAIHANIHPIIITAALEYPTMFQSFEDVEDPNTNNYIYHPKRPLPAFVTPRSLHKASDVLRATENLPDSVRTHALMGLVGEAAAFDIMTLTRLDETLPSLREALASPDGCKVPARGVAQVLLCQKLIMGAEVTNFDACMTYIQRLPKEIQAMFGKGVMAIASKREFAVKIKSFTDWARGILEVLN